MMTPKAVVLKRLGSPDSSVGGSVYYDLGVRRDYIFEFVFSLDREVLVESGYERKEPRRVAMSRPGSEEEAEQLRAFLVAQGATKAELRRGLGIPVSRDGWWPYETWSYGDFLALELRLGVVE